MEQMEAPERKKHILPSVPFWHSVAVRVFAAIYSAFALVILFFVYGDSEDYLPFSPIFLLFAVSFILSLALTYVITRPVRLLVRHAWRAAEGDNAFSAVTKRQDEIGQLFRFFSDTVSEIRESQERNIALSQIKSQFVMVAAHQLRTPLSAMKWSLRLMLDGDMGDLTEKQREFLQQSYQTNEHMIRLANDFLDISRIEEGRFGFQFKKSRILDTIKKAVEESSAQATMRGVHVSFTSTVPADLEIIVDESRMYTAVTNLLDNAIRYSNNGGDVTVRAALKEPEGFLEVEIADSGIGIPAVEQKKVFSRFYRASNAVRQQPDGSGLGLFITRNIIERHGGAIRFASTEGKGTTMIFTLPAKEDFIKKQEESFPLQEAV